MEWRAAGGWTYADAVDFFRFRFRLRDGAVDVDKGTLCQIKRIRLQLQEKLFICVAEISTKVHRVLRGNVPVAAVFAKNEPRSGQNRPLVPE